MIAKLTIIISQNTKKSSDTKFHVDKDNKMTYI